MHDPPLSPGPDAPVPAATRPPWASAARWLVLALLLTLVGTLLWAAGAQGWSSADVVAAVRRAGPWGGVAFVLAFAFVQPLGVSGHVFCLAAAALWPPWQALGLAWLGAVGSALVAMAGARWLAYDAVQARLTPRLRSVQDRLIRGGWTAAFLVRLLAFTAHPVQVLFGVVPLPFARVLSATALGFLPTVAVDVLLGGELLGLLGWARS